MKPSIRFGKSHQGRPTIAHGFNRGLRVERGKSPAGAKEKLQLRRPVLSSLTGLDSYPHHNPAMNRWAIFGSPYGTWTHDTPHTYLPLAEGQAFGGPTRCESAARAASSAQAG